MWVIASQWILPISLHSCYVDFWFYYSLWIRNSDSKCQQQAGNKKKKIHFLHLQQNAQLIWLKNFHRPMHFYWWPRPADRWVFFQVTISRLIATHSYRTQSVLPFTHSSSEENSWSHTPPKSTRHKRMQWTLLEFELSSPFPQSMFCQ